MNALRDELVAAHPGKVEVVAVNVEWDADPTRVNSYTNPSEGPIHYPFAQDIAAAKVWASYQARRHDIVLVGPDGFIRQEWRGANALPIEQPAALATLKAAILATIP